MMAAQAAGIKVFATGGIGGVHRGAENDFDVSADLTELAQTNVAVVCAGAKSILDLPKTLEVLETQGVPIWGWQCDEFPSFFTRSSGLSIEDRFDDLEALAACMQTHFAMGGNGGALNRQPRPSGHFALDGADEARGSSSACRCKERRLFRGRRQHRILLGKLVELSGGQTLRANLALVENNVDLASRLAVAMTTVKRL